MDSLRPFIATLVAMSLAACGTTMPTPRSGFLGDYAALTATSDGSAASRASIEPIDPARVTIDAVLWQVKTTADISADERDTLAALWRSELARRVQAMPAVPHGRPAVLRAAITRIETVSPVLNAVGSLLLLGPLDRGGAAVEVEAVDPHTRRQIAAMTQGYFAPLSELKARFSKLAPAEIALRKAAADFVPLLHQVSEAGNRAAQH